MSEQNYSQSDKLSDYPRPSVAVDVAAFTYSRDFNQLSFLAINNDSGGFRLPGSFLRENEQLAHAVTRTMAEKVGMKTNRPTLLEVFDQPGRDPRGWVITIAHLLVVPESEAQHLNRNLAKWIPVHLMPDLQGDHDAIVESALERLRVEYEIDQSLVKDRGVSSETARMLRSSEFREMQSEMPPYELQFASVNFSAPPKKSRIPRNVYSGKPDPEGFFSQPFTLRELQSLHEVVAGRVFLSPKPKTLDSTSGLTTSTLRDTFRRLMEPQLSEAGTNEGSFSTRGAPSRTWRVKR